MNTKKKYIMRATVAAFAGVILAGAGMGCRNAVETGNSAGQTAEQTTQISSPAETTEKVTQESATERKTEKKPVAVLEETSTVPEETTPEQETGSIYEGGIPASTDNFIIKEDADTFFEGSVFIGDSVMMGFRNYVMGQPQGFLGGPDFLVSGSFSLRMALARISESSIHPVYQGEQRFIWDSIAMLKAKKAFLFFGLNDIDMAGVEGTCANYAEVVGNIRNASPETEIYIISMTNVLNGSEVGGLNNANIRLLNEKVKEYCETADVQFIDIASFLVDENGGLKQEYCSDGYVHQNAAAYDVWTKVLRWYASGGEYLIPEEQETTKEAGQESETTTTQQGTAEGTEPETTTAAEVPEETETDTTAAGLAEVQTETVPVEQETTPAPEITATEETTATAN